MHAHSVRAGAAYLPLTALLLVLTYGTAFADFQVTDGATTLMRLTNQGDLIFEKQQNGRLVGGVRRVGKTERGLLEPVAAEHEFLLYAWDNDVNPGQSRPFFRLDPSDGLLYIFGRVYENQGALVQDPNQKELVFKNGTTTVAIFSPNGDLYLRGRVYPRTVVLDPGRGGDDPGACREEEPVLYEKNLTLALAEDLRDAIERLGDSPRTRIRVFLTRENDTKPELEARAHMAATNCAACFLSLHFNGGPASARGTEIFVRTCIENPNPGDSQINFNADRGFAEAVGPEAWNGYRYFDRDTLILEPGHTIPWRDNDGDPATTLAKQGTLAVLSDEDDHLDNPWQGPALSVAALLEMDFIYNNGFAELWWTLDPGETSEAAGRSPDDVHENVAEATAAAIHHYLGLD
jgi:N-acetylmuramoyl-L-alanine amidase